MDPQQQQPEINPQLLAVLRTAAKITEYGQTILVTTNTQTVHCHNLTVCEIRTTQNTPSNNRMM